METGVGFTVRMFSARAAKYEDSWHPKYSKRFVEMTGLSPGQRVLDLCCGTGLEAFLAVEHVGDEGEVVGVDVTQAMLDQALGKKTALAARSPAVADRLHFLRADVTRLDALPELVRGSFDVIMCSCALPLISDPEKALALWRDYLKPGGAVAVDMPHERNAPLLAALGRVAQRMKISWPTDMGRISSSGALQKVLQELGFEIEKVVEVEAVSGRGPTHFGVEDADAQFDGLLDGHLNLSAAVPEIGAPGFREKARPIFREEFAKEAVGGKIEIADSIFFYLARMK